MSVSTTNSLSSVFQSIETDERIKQLVELYNRCDEDLRKRGLEMYLNRLDKSEIEALCAAWLSADVPARQYIVGDCEQEIAREQLRKFLTLGRRLLLSVQNRQSNQRSVA